MITFHNDSKLDLHKVLELWKATRKVAVWGLLEPSLA